jgi:hypothetical protein
MTDFRGPRNLHLGHPVWAASTYDATTRDYVVTLEGDDIERFRSVADLYGFREVDAEPTDGPVEGDGHEREFVDLAYAIDNPRDLSELEDDVDEDGDDESDDDVDEDTDEAGDDAKPDAKPARRRRAASN